MVNKMQNLSKIHWKSSEKPVPYQSAIDFMEDRVANIAAGTANECIWLLEHPSLYTAGTSAKPPDLLTPDRFPVYKTGRGGEYTYHGPGQRIAYVMLDLNKRQKDVRWFVFEMESWVIASLASLGLKAERRSGRVGLWVKRPIKDETAKEETAEDKIAAIGIRLRKWVSFHGLSINVSPDLEHFSGIVPCGISQHGVTSLADLNIKVTMEDIDQALKSTFNQHFLPR